MACCSSTKTEQLVSKRAETLKAFAAGANAFLNSPSCLIPEAALPSQLYGLFTAACGAGLLTSSCALTLWISDACSSGRAVSCAIVAPKSAVVAGANAKAGSQIEKPGWVANALSMTRFPRWRARSRKADVVRAPSA
jgi:hypothetical protein